MPPPPRPAVLLSALAVVVLALAVWSGTLSASFVSWDDGITIYSNPKLGPLDAERLRYAFTDVATTMRWIPLTLLSLSFTYTFHGLDPFGYHLANWLLHGASVLVLFLLLLEVLGRTERVRRGGVGTAWLLASAAAGALLWALHPLRAEVVAWSNSRGHAQGTLLALAALLVYARAHREGAAPRRAWIGTGVSAVAYLAALMSHPIAIGAAPLFPLLDVHLGRLGGAAGFWSPAARRVLAEKLPHVAATGAVLAVTLVVRTFHPGIWDPPVPLSEWGLFPRAMQATWIWVHYVLVTLWPAGLQPAPTDLIDFDPVSAPFLLRALLVVAVTAALVALRRRWPAALLLWLAHLALVVPALGLTEHPMFACDRYASLPGLVPAAVAGAALLAIGSDPARRRLAGAGAAAVLAALSVRSVAQARVWTDSITLFRHMLPLIGDHPYRANVFLLLGQVLGGRGEPAAAAAAYQQAVVLKPLDGDLRGALGDELVKAGRPEEAIAHLRQATRLLPAKAELRCKHAGALLAAGRPGEALAVAREAFLADPRAACAQVLLARIPAAAGP